jgi:uncharacterized membrane protein required for colicin V production
MLFDVLLALVLIGSVLAGVWRGALLEVLSLTAFAAAVGFCQVLGAALAPGLAPALPDTGPLSVYAAAVVVAGLAILLVGTAVTAVIVRRARRRKSFAPADRIVGGVLGGLRGVGLWLVVACFVPSTADTAATWLGRQMQGSVLLTAANRANPLQQLTIVKDVRTFESLMRHPDRQDEFFRLPETRVFLAQPSVASAAEAPEAQQAIFRADLPALLRCPPVQAALLHSGALRAFRRALAAYRQKT